MRVTNVAGSRALGCFAPGVALHKGSVDYRNLNGEHTCLSRALKHRRLGQNWFQLPGQSTAFRLMIAKNAASINDELVRLCCRFCYQFKFCRFGHHRCRVPAIIFVFLFFFSQSPPSPPLTPTPLLLPFALPTPFPIPGSPAGSLSHAGTDQSRFCAQSPSLRVRRICMHY